MAKNFFFIDVYSKAPFPGNKLSNFYPHCFIIDDIECASMEGFLQALKHADPYEQTELCRLSGSVVKNTSADIPWKEKQTLYWKGRAYRRESVEYQTLLDQAYAALSENPEFREALLASGHRRILHSIGKNNPKDTVLTKSEFCSRLTRIRRSIKRK